MTPSVTFAEGATASFGNCNLFAATFKPDIDKTKRIADAINKNTPPEVAKATLKNSGTVLQFMYIGINDKINVVTRPFPATDHDNTTISLAGRGDAMDILSPVTFCTKHFHGHGIILVTAEQATTCNLASNDVNPLQLDDPSGGGVKETKEDDPIMIEQPTKRIGWKNPIGPNDQPVFVAIRVMLPVPPGVKPPIGLNIRTDVLPPLQNCAGFPALKSWFEGMKYLWTHNKNLSLHANSHLFKIDDIDPIHFY
jgi:hypothetical protein